MRSQLGAIFGRVWVQHLVVVVLAGALLLPNLGLGLYDPWETHYAEVARRIWVHGDWITLRWHADSRLGRDVSGECPGNPEVCYFFSKPVLIYWLMGLSLGAAGVNEEDFDRLTQADRDAVPRLMNRNDAAARFPMVLIGLLGIFGAYYYVRRMVGLRAGLLAAAVLATTPYYYTLSRQIMTDIAFVVPMMVGLLAIAYWLESPRETARPRHLYLFYALAGLATLAKGLLGFMLPGAILFVYLVIRHPLTLLSPIFCWDRALAADLFRAPRRFWRTLISRNRPLGELLFDRLRLLRGALVFLSVAGPWYGAVWAINGDRWFNEFIIKHHFRRVGAGVHGERGTFEYFIEQLGYGLWPWVALVPLALGVAWLGWRQRGEGDRRAMALRTLLISWAAVAFGLFTISTTKFHHYIFPAVPPMALLVGITLARLLEQQRVRARERALLILGVALLLLITPILAGQPYHFINLFIYGYDRRWPEIEGAELWLGAAGAIFALGLILLLIRRRISAWVPALLCVGALVGAGWVVHGLMVEMIDFVSQRSSWEAVHRVREPGDRIYQWGMRWRGENWYSFDDIHEIPQQSTSRMRRELSRPGRAIIATLSLGRLNTRLRRLFGRSLEPINEHHDRYVMTLWEGPPEGSAERYVVDAVPPSATALEARLGDDIELIAYDLAPRRIRPESTVRVTLYFRATRRPRQDWAIFIHGDLPDQNRRQRIVNDHPPADGLLPTTRWAPGQIIRDEAELVTEREQRAGTYSVFVGLFNDDGRMPVSAGPNDGDNRIELGTFEVRR